MSEPVRVLVSLVAAVVVGVAEVVIYAVYLGKISQARDRERKVKERKVVYESEKVGGGERHEGEKEEEIWGRGVNGGLRRRVRERWEEREKERVKDGDDG